MAKRKVSKKKVGTIKRKPGLFYYVDGGGNIMEMKPSRGKKKSKKK